MNWEGVIGNPLPEVVATADRICLIPMSCPECANHLRLSMRMFIAGEVSSRAVVPSEMISAQLQELAIAGQ